MPPRPHLSLAAPGSRRAVVVGAGSFGTAVAGLGRADYVFLGVPSRGLDEVIEGLERAGLGRRTPVVSLAKGLVPPDGLAPTTLLSNVLGASRVACVRGPAHAREMVTEGVPAAEIPERIGQAVEALDMVPLLADALEAADIEAPETNALNRLIAGELPLDDWVAQVRATVPAPARFDSAALWRRWWWRLRHRPV